jgi:hypothetical protein
MEIHSDIRIFKEKTQDVRGVEIMIQYDNDVMVMKNDAKKNDDDDRSR